jgi:fatty-acyl-CoA synthase
MTPHDHPTFAGLVLRALARFPDRIAFQAGDRRVSYAEAAGFIGRAQALLHVRGLARGQRLAVLSANRWESWCISVAAQALGATVTPLHPLGALDAHLFQLADADASVLLVDADAYAARGGEIAERCPGLAVLTLGATGDGDDLLQRIAAHGSATARDLSHPSDLATLNYTGGTTGRPKGVVKTSAANALMTLAVMAEFELPRRPSYLAVAPISHVTGTNVLPVLCRGGTVHLLPRFEPEAVLATIARERINFALLVPTMVYVLLDDPALVRHDLSSLELLLYGASPMSPARLGEALERIGPVFSQLYGQSECYPIAALPKADHDPARPHLLAACGFATSVCHVALLDDALQPVPPGEPGEICVRGGTVMSGYWRQPAQTDEALAGGWLHTGDIARQDEEGRLYIVDRKKDMVVTGGFNVYPREVEDALASHPAVAQAAVFGTPDAKWGEAVKAVVVLRPGQQASADELTALVRERKGALHAPKQVVFVSQLPLTPLGKIDKKALRAQDWAGAGRSIG